MAIKTLQGLMPLQAKAQGLAGIGNSKMQAAFAAKHPRAAYRAGFAPKPQQAPVQQQAPGPQPPQNIKQSAQSFMGSPELANQAMDALGSQQPQQAPVEQQAPQGWQQRMAAMGRPAGTIAPLSPALKQAAASGSWQAPERYQPQFQQNRMDLQQQLGQFAQQNQPQQLLGDPNGQS
jgi:hypothetical protein